MPVRKSEGSEIEVNSPMVEKLNNNVETKVAIYSRVSTRDQETGNQSLILRNWAAQRNFKIVAEYEEEESAWKNGHQAQLACLLEDAHKRQFDFVLVWALDRLTREGPTSILKLVDRLKHNNVRILSYQESWTEAPGELGDLLYAIVGWVARMESQRRSERTKAGMERKKRELGGELPKRGKDKRKRKRRVT